MKRTISIALLTLLSLTALAQTKQAATSSNRNTPSPAGEHRGETSLHGTWHGVLKLNELQLNLVFHLTNDSTCTLDSPDQGAKGIQGRVKELTADKANLLFPLLMATYTAELKDGKLVGTFTQSGYRLPLTLEPGLLVRQRPQTPQPPFPYETREVKIAIPSPYGGETEGGFTLSATLTLPAGLRRQGDKESRSQDNSSWNVAPHSTKQKTKNKKQKTQDIRPDSLTPCLLDSLENEAPPCLLLVTGSGLQNRDEELFEHKPFAVIADYLARHGIATLRYDDRGFGQSTGDATTCTTLDFAHDAEAALQYLRSLKVPLPTGEDSDVGLFSRIGILGHSEGGSIAFMLAAQRDDTPFAVHPDFLVTLAAPGIKGDTLLVEQTNALLTLSGKPANMTLRTMRLIMATQDTNPWYQFFTEYDPADDIRATRCPVLALNGSLDKQVLPQSNLAAIRQLLNLSEYPDALPLREGMEAGFYKLYPGLNHLFQHATTGAATEYGTIEETIAPEVLRDIANWVNSLK